MFTLELTWFLSRFCLNGEGRKEGQEFRSLEVRRKLIALKKRIFFVKLQRTLPWSFSSSLFFQFQGFDSSRDKLTQHDKIAVLIGLLTYQALVASWV